MKKRIPFVILLLVILLAAITLIAYVSVMEIRNRPSWQSGLKGYRLSDDGRTVRLFCDIDGDGAEDTIEAEYFDTLTDDQRMIEVIVQRADGTRYSCDTLGLPHTAWKDLYVVLIDDYPCLMEYHRPEESQGLRFFSYQVYRYDEFGRKVIVAEQNGSGDLELEWFQNRTGKYFEHSEMFLGTRNKKITVMDQVYDCSH